LVEVREVEEETDERDIVDEMLLAFVEGDVEMAEYDRKDGLRIVETG